MLELERFGNFLLSGRLAQYKAVIIVMIMTAVCVSVVMVRPPAGAFEEVLIYKRKAIARDAMAFLLSFLVQIAKLLNNATLFDTSLFTSKVT